MEWKFWLPIVLAGIQALYQVLGYYRENQSAQAAPMPFASPYGSGPVNRRYAILGIIMLLTWAAVGFNYYDRHYSSQFPQWPDPYRPISVINKTFKNEEVVLDGYSYDHCAFENVTFIYNGTTPPQITVAEVRGSVKYRTHNPAVGGIAAVFRALGDLPNVSLQFSNPNNIVRAPGEPIQ